MEGAQLTITARFAIGYIYSFFATGVFYYGFNHFFPHLESRMDYAETGEDIIAANDAKNMEAKYAGRRPSLITRAFQV